MEQLLIPKYIFGFLIEVPVTPEFHIETGTLGPTTDGRPIDSSHFRNVDGLWVKNSEIKILAADFFDAVEKVKALYGTNLNIVSAGKYPI